MRVINRLFAFFPPSHLFPYLLLAILDDWPTMGWIKRFRYDCELDNAMTVFQLKRKVKRQITASFWYILIFFLAVSVSWWWQWVRCGCIQTHNIVINIILWPIYHDDIVQLAQKSWKGHLPVGPWPLHMAATAACTPAWPPRTDQGPRKVWSKLWD